MRIQLLIPSQNQKSVSIQVLKDEKVSTLRKMVTKVVNVPESSFLLIASGKIMLDKCLDKKPATLYSTYRVKDKTCVFVHLKQQQQVPVVQPKIKRETKKRVRKSSIIRDLNVISTPFGNPLCPECKNDNGKKKCAECGCVKCLLKTGDPLICDQCDNYWHAECAGLSGMPKDQYWYCPECYNHDGKVIVGKGDAMKVSNTPKPTVTIQDNECVLVSQYHVGKIPGIYCGQSWAYRSLLSEWGVHRSNSSGVCGSITTGAVSIVLSLGMKEDRDDGYEFTMSGSGGGVRRKGCVDHSQVKTSQTLTRSNRALAITCDAPLNEEVGARARNWRKSRPVRVCRSAYLSKTNPKFAPSEGVRYDGLYKLVKYWPHTDRKTGIIVWKFLFRRDDQELPPWMTGGKVMMKKRGLRMIRMDNELTKKLVKYNIPPRVKKLMLGDTQNERLWDQVNQMEFWSEYEFLHYVFDSAVTCSSNVCPKPIKDPISAPCGHICCMECLNQSKSNQCFTCRAEIPISAIKVNEKLIRILQTLNWTYIPTEETLHPTVKREFTQLSLADHLQKPKKVKICIEYLG